MERSGRIVACCQGGQVLVEVVRDEACGACQARGACASLASGRPLHHVLDGAVDGRPGDQVRIVLDDASFLATCALAYLVPVLCLVAGAVLGARSAVLTSSADLAAALGALLGLALGMVPLGWWGRRRGVARPRLELLAPRREVMVGSTAPPAAPRR